MLAVFDATGQLGWVNASQKKILLEGGVKLGLFVWQEWVDFSISTVE